MEKIESKKSIPNLKVETDGEVERQKIIAKLAKGHSTMFILTKNFDLHLGVVSHGDIRRRSNIEWDNEFAVGVVRLEKNKISVKTYDKIPEETESAIKEAVNIFLVN